MPPSGDSRAAASPAPSQPRTGIDAWTNAGNGFRVVQVHYTADPVKRTPAWQAATFRAMPPRNKKREYDIDWTASEGDPVVPEYEAALHDRALVIDPSLRLLRFWDFGFDSPVVLFAQLNYWDQLLIFRELCPFNLTLRELIPAATAMAKDLLGFDAWTNDRGLDYSGQEPEAAAFAPIPDEVSALAGSRGRSGEGPERRIFDAGDPEGYSRKSLGVEAGVMREFGLRLHIARPGTQESYQSMRDRFTLRRMIPGQGQQPAILIDPACQLLRKALAGAFSKSPLPPYKPKKIHPYKDLVDALRYGIDNLDAFRKGVDARLRTLATQDVRETRV